MPFNGNGTYALPSPAYPAVSDREIFAADRNGIDSDIATALSNCITRDGQSPALANISFGGFKGIALAIGVSPTDAVAMSQILNRTWTGTQDFTGAVISVPTQTAGNNTTKAASTAFVQAAAFNSALPLQTGNAGKFVTTDGTTASWGILPGKNRLINGNFSFNQRAVSGTVTLAAGAYGHDRFKAGAAGCTYTFATASNVTTITISAGSLQQVVEGLNLQSGTHVLSWSGTAQGRINGGAYGASGAVTAVAVGGTNMTVEFNAGTLSLAQLETGSLASAFEQRFYDVELALCRWYCRAYEIVSQDYHGGMLPAAATYLPTGQVFMPPMRAVPTVSTSAATNNFSAASLSASSSRNDSFFFTWSRSSAGWNTGSNTASFNALLTAEL